MLVDDKLAKEKLAREVESEMVSLHAGTRLYIYLLIRNTDLTDCQPQQQNEYMSVTQAGNDPSATPSGAQDETAWLIEMPAARWGTGYFWSGPDGRYSSGSWDTIDKAIRFSRKEDAENIIKRINDRRDPQPLEACEHMWPATGLSDFIRNASPEKREQVYTEVMEKATARQMATGTDSTRSEDRIKPDGADQGSVRNATDKQTDEYVAVPVAPVPPSAVDSGAHTKEPWRVIDATGDELAITTDDRMLNDVVAITEVEINWEPAFDAEQRANAFRIVACVNACKGIPTEDLERWGISLIDKIREDEATGSARAASNSGEERIAKMRERCAGVADEWGSLRAAAAIRALPDQKD